MKCRLSLKFRNNDTMSLDDDAKESVSFSNRGVLCRFGRNERKSCLARMNRFVQPQQSCKTRFES